MGRLLCTGIPTEGEGEPTALIEGATLRPRTEEKATRAGCGKEIRGGIRTCGYCGAPVTGAGAAAGPAPADASTSSVVLVKAG